MSDGKRQDGPAFFVGAEMKDSKTEGGNRYAWSKTFDMKAIERELGTSVCTITVIKPRNAKSADERLLIFKPSDPKYIPKKKDGQGSGGGSKPASKNDEVEL